MNASANVNANVRRSLLAAGLVGAALLLIYYQTTWSMVSIWSRSDTFAHGFLVLPISIWLIWTRREHLRGINPVPALSVAFLLLLPAVAWLLAWLVDVSVVQQLALIAMLIVAMWAVMGHQLARVLAFPLLFLFFAVPLGEGLIPPMMEFTATSTIWMIKLTGIPVYREGLQFSLPSGYWSVVEACSGVRYIIASVTVGTLYAYLTYRSWPRRLLFVLVSFIVPILANTVRAFMIVMLGHLSGMTLATGADHLVYGWVFFGLVIFLLFWLGGFFREDEAPPPAVDATSSLAHTSASSVSVLTAALAVFLAASIARGVASQSATESALSPHLVFDAPTAAGDWQPLRKPNWLWKPPARVAGERSAYYQRGARGVGLSIQYDDGTVEGGDVLGSSTYLTEWQSGYNVAELGSTSARLRGAQFRPDEAWITGIDDGLLVWSWYYVSGNSTANAYVAKLQQAQGRLGFASRGTYRIILTTPLQVSQADTRGIFQDFLDVHGESLYEELRRIGMGEP